MTLIGFQTRGGLGSLAAKPHCSGQTATPGAHPLGRLPRPVSSGKKTFSESAWRGVQRVPKGRGQRVLLCPSCAGSSCSCIWGPGARGLWPPRGLTVAFLSALTACLSVGGSSLPAEAGFRLRWASRVFRKSSLQRPCPPSAPAPGLIETFCSFIFIFRAGEGGREGGRETSM